MSGRWNQVPFTGHEEIDGLREELWQRAEQLVNAARGSLPAETRAHVQRVRELARALFEAEERRLLARGAASLERHRAAHARFLDDLAVLGVELGRRGAEALAELKPDRFVAEWLAAHGRQSAADLGEPEAKA